MVWEDEGAFFILGFNVVVMTIILLLVCCCHAMKGNARILRPNRWGSTTTALFTCGELKPAAASDSILYTHGPRAALNVSLKRWHVMIALTQLIPAIIHMILNGTDKWRNDYALSSSNPYECSSERNETECRQKSRWCDWSGSSCGVVKREGLADLTMQNLTPDVQWRLALYGIVICISVILFMLMGSVFLGEIQRVTRTSLFQRGAQGPQAFLDETQKTEKSTGIYSNERLCPPGSTPQSLAQYRLPSDYTGIGSIAARSVYVKGVPDDFKSTEGYLRAATRVSAEEPNRFEMWGLKHRQIIHRNMNIAVQQQLAIPLQINTHGGPARAINKLTTEPDNMTKEMIKEKQE